MHTIILNNKKRLFTYFLIAFLGKMAFAQNTVATNIRVKIEKDKAEIQYDIPIGKGGAEQLFAVSLSTDNEMIVPKKLTDVGNNIRPGFNRKITWYFASEGFTRDEVARINFKVIATPVKGGKKAKSADDFSESSTKKGKKKFPILGVTLLAAGAGLGTYGFLENQVAVKDYAIYKDQTNLKYNDPSQYKLANNRHLNAQYMLIGGGVLLTTGVFAVLKTRKKNKARQDLGFIPSFSPTSVGVGITYRF